MKRETNTAVRKYYLCNNCGFSLSNRSTWCDLGCGSDYNKMIEIEDWKIDKRYNRKAELVEEDKTDQDEGDQGAGIAD